MKKTNRFTVAITGMNALPENPAPGISVASCLRKSFGNKVRIVGLGYDAFDVGLYAEDLCDAAYLLPYPRFGSEALFLRLLDIKKEERIDALIPCLDSELSGIIGMSDRLLGIGIHTFLPTADQLMRCHKDRLPELASKINLHYPEVKALFSPDFFNFCHFEGWTYPLIVKGPFYDARKVFSSSEATEAFNDMVKDWGYPILVQRFIQGEECNFSAIGDGQGGMIGGVTIKKVALTSKNKACVGVTIADEAVFDYAQNMVKELQWKGPFELELMCDSGGNYHLIEINPRFPAWISISEKAGQNLPARLIEMILGLEQRSVFDSPVTGTYFIRYSSEQMVTLNQLEQMIAHGTSVVDTKE
ncbi:ATP-grasp domain-containing protein [Legionella worsleiensis]|uniref:Carbamoyl phosphate synthase-like protein n=1 Tax=Legionella worsleiensis TaxID=45076 RepID=A0A0W1AA71_9GAMM|nr:ATP-grasp domain-containing protein [Legionella worsleiensis]KTD78239.1 carbamoyl phosphate synthase-like protein [Legionella worsleiensis]STY32576.1 carbamoyl phosphate synthase-like protein [Legionella worsleiensis]